ncbi:MAG: hypothetical protein MPL62_02110 [Alphaproteobacteria bacterium]|nr:hypothetical protein [Alphaproteobacteria bacterium]MDA8009305.1 hypothetical protein [Alphaproteobacteria bacterium]
MEGGGVVVVDGRHRVQVKGDDKRQRTAVRSSSFKVSFRKTKKAAPFPSPSDMSIIQFRAR